MACLVLFLENSSNTVASLDEVDTLTVGRHPNSDLLLSDPSVSTRHAVVKLREDGWYVQDLNSSNGTRLNGAEIEEALLGDGDRVSFGDVQGIFCAGAAPQIETVASAPPASPPPPTLAYAPEGPPVGVPSRRAAVAKRSVARKTSSSYPEDTGSGCLTAAFLTGLFLVAFIVGLALRHSTETDRNLMGDLIQRITRSLPKVKIEQ